MLPEIIPHGWQYFVRRGSLDSPQWWAEKHGEWLTDWPDHLNRCPSLYHSMESAQLAISFINRGLTPEACRIERRRLARNKRQSNETTAGE